MAFGFDNNHNLYLYCNQKRCFLILLLFNSLLACIYYFHEQNQFRIPRNITNHPERINTNLPRKQTKALKFIRNILENEYNQNDLGIFYNLVEKEFSLGLRCTRKPTQPPTTTLATNSNLTIDDSRNNSIR
jgi:hypothetical protein